MRLAMTVSALLLSVAMTASAAVPDPGQSIFNPCLVFCPEGDIPLTVVVRDVGGNPVPGALVTLNTCDCPEVRYCPLTGDENYLIQSGCEVSGVADASGKIAMGIRAGGTCLGSVELRADGVLLHTYGSVASTDLNADSFVTAVDQAILLGNAGSLDPRFDLNCQPPSDGADQAVMDEHLDHSCSGPVQTLGKTWGSVKAIYR